MRMRALLLLAFASCGDPAASDDDAPCVPGYSRPCECDDEAGAQVCEPDGFGFGACSCEPGAQESSSSDPSDPDPSDPDPSDPDPSDPDPSDPDPTDPDPSTSSPTDPTDPDPTGDTGDPVIPSFALDIVPILEESCGANDGACHSRNAYAASVDFDCRGWLALENAPLGAQLYAPDDVAGTPTGCPDYSLYDRLFMVAWQCAPEQGEPGYPYVIPGDAAGSFIMRKIDADYGECGVPPDSQPMPPPGEPWELSAAQRDVLAAWITAGAPNN